MIVPHAQARYHDLRGDLAVTDAIDLDGEVGLHPDLTFVADQFGTGNVALIEGVGYPDPDLSHFASMSTWWTAMPGAVGSTGWLGRYLDGTVGASDPLAGVSIGPGPNPALVGDTAVVASIQSSAGIAPAWIDEPSELFGMWSGFAPADADPGSPLAVARDAIADTVAATASRSIWPASTHAATRPTPSTSGRTTPHCSTAGWAHRTKRSSVRASRPSVSWGPSGPRQPDDPGCSDYPGTWPTLRHAMRSRLALLFAAALVASACGDVLDELTQPTPAGPATTTASTLPQPSGGETATIVKVLDGDSLEAQVDGADVEVRLLGINTPEGWECHGNAAKEAFVGLLTGTEVTLVADPAVDQDQFDRLLRYVYLDGANLNAEMVRRGHALALQLEHQFEVDFKTFENRAFADGLGMWALDACDEDAVPEVTIVDVNYDAPGKDSENPNGEFALIRNDGDEAVDLGEWRLRDESSSHRYDFPAVTLEPGDEIRITSGCGTDEDDALRWCARDPVWSNGGDTALLQTPEGTVVSRYVYEGDY
ncbi:MAG: hypothetical protein HKN46_02345 [Acidimicrobiia bacterium]|nr:hypothetical protein [Acidimicrobiia bacterium]